MKRSEQFVRGVEARAKLNRGVSSTVVGVRNGLGWFGEFTAGFVAGEEGLKPKRAKRKTAAKRKPAAKRKSVKK